MLHKNYHTIVKRRAGFTLVEMLVAITVLTTITGFGTANYLNFSERQTLTQAGQTLMNNLRYVQGKALSGEKDATICTVPVTLANIPLKGWCFSPGSGAKDYSIYGACVNIPPEPAEPTPSPYPFSQKFYNLENNVSIRGSAVYPDGSVASLALDKLRIGFKSLSGGVEFSSDLVPPPDTIVYCLDSSLPTLSDIMYVIRVGRGGEIIDGGIVDNEPTCQ